MSNQSGPQNVGFKEFSYSALKLITLPAINCSPISTPIAYLALPAKLSIIRRTCFSFGWAE
jgi:hypothetical protein